MILFLTNNKKQGNIPRLIFTQALFDAIIQQIQKIQMHRYGAHARIECRVDSRLAQKASLKYT